jgi:branched-chain amino acid transport system ATP-binding protein
MQANAILTTEDLNMRFGGLLAVSDFSAAIPQGSITGLIGPNGAGKTTCFNMITGFYRPTTGRVVFNGHDITGLPPHKVCRAGIARTFQNIRLFSNGPCSKTLIGRHLAPTKKLAVGPGLHPGLPCARQGPSAPQALDAVPTRAVAGRRGGGKKAASLPTAPRRRLKSLPAPLGHGTGLLLLDEPAAGLNPRVRRPHGIRAPHPRGL